MPGKFEVYLRKKNILGGSGMRKDTFSTYHPVINFAYYISVIVFSMVFMHPVFLGVSFLCAFIYSVYLGGKKALKFNLFFFIFMIIFSSVFNSLFSHYGVTPLFTLPGGNQFTLESLIYSIASGIMLTSVIMWFSCYNVTMTGDKFIYLFGRIIPALSLIFSMVLRFVPKYKAQAKVIINAQKCVGQDPGTGTIKERAKSGMNILSILMSWALENGIETSDSMKSRGYGLKGRTAYSIYRFDNRDRLFVIILSTLIICVITGASLGQNNIMYNPEIVMNKITPFSLLIYIIYCVLCLMPVFVNVADNLIWKRKKMNIKSDITEPGGIL